MRDRLLTTGIVGTAVAALCCLTPLLVIILAALGLSAWLGWADYVLLPAMALFPAMAVFALLRRRRSRTSCRS